MPRSLWLALSLRQSRWLSFRLLLRSTALLLPITKCTAPRKIVSRIVVMLIMESVPATVRAIGRPVAGCSTQPRSLPIPLRLYCDSGLIQPSQCSSRQISTPSRRNSQTGLRSPVCHSRSVRARRSRRPHLRGQARTHGTSRWSRSAIALSRCPPGPALTVSTRSVEEASYETTDLLDGSDNRCDLFSGNRFHARSSDHDRSRSTGSRKRVLNLRALPASLSLLSDHQR